MLDCGESKELEHVLREMVPNYKINLLDCGKNEFAIGCGSQLVIKKKKL